MAKSPEELEMFRQMFGKDAVKDNIGETTTSTEAAATTDAPENKTETTTINSELEFEVVESGKEEAAAAAPIEKEFTEDEIVALLKKRGISVDSLEALKPKADPSVEAEKRENKKLTFALENNLITRKEYESYIADNANKEHVSYAEFAAEAKAEDAEISDEQIREDFNEEYGLNADPESLKYKRGQKKMALAAEKIIKEKHAKYFGIDSKFNDFEKEGQAKTARATKIYNQLPDYTKAVDEAVSELSSLTFNLGDSTYSVKIDQKTLDSIKEPWTNKDVAEKNIMSDLSKDDIKAAIKMTLLQGNFDKIINSVVNKKLEAKAKGVRNIPSNEAVRQELKASGKVFNEMEKAELKRMGLPIPTAAN